MKTRFQYSLFQAEKKYFKTKYLVLSFLFNILTYINSIFFRKADIKANLMEQDEDCKMRKIKKENYIKEIKERKKKIIINQYEQIKNIKQQKIKQKKQEKERQIKLTTNIKCIYEICDESKTKNKSYHFKEQIQQKFRQIKKEL
ncbi:transmembrane protein, putative (macronuclear) [Tetrahymena thermophila SB210]|uniref:Transmembrane protein, putative n=1 Tax=Tetrahymena thermophila (strain SB210) TaxID=312017 RepID=W7X4S8_TETTS|nr:transmembrane protein, putative [Tetrahymena thermophila SB210]EWS72422.1 transmembrane protein, putative [Tetrahymena thermophila SB210]|eukprot:XP_012655049.1 transmembrane protein, putative [Tetrahymena thermophila SB210]